MPQANTLFIGRLPPIPGWGAGETVVQPQIIDTDRAHPIMQSLELGDVDIMEARPLKPPPGSARLIESNKGPLMAVAAREGFEDAVLGFELISVEQGAAVSNTTWPIKLSFPVFLSNLLQYFGGNREAAAQRQLPARASRRFASRHGGPAGRVDARPRADRGFARPAGHV